MEPLGINTGLLFVQLAIVAVMLALPVISLIDLARKRLSGTSLALWVLVICIVPVLGSLAYWIVRPAPEPQQN